MKAVPSGMHAAKWNRGLARAAGEGSKIEYVSVFHAGLNQPEKIELNKAKRSIRGRAEVVKVPAHALLDCLHDVTARCHTCNFCFR